jgi:hypothetical protein
MIWKFQTDGKWPCKAQRKLQVKERPWPWAKVFFDAEPNEDTYGSTRLSTLVRHTDVPQ